MQSIVQKKRIESIDMVRGIAMVIMALDHARDYFHIAAFTEDPLDVTTTTSALFFTRWITHFCAPIFIFLSGVSIYLQSFRKTNKELGTFLLKRGFWIIFAEISFVCFGWTFNTDFTFIPLQVIWAIGISMVILGLIVLLKISYKVIFALGILIVAGHNLLDIPEAAKDFQPGFFWNLLHSGFFATYEFTSGHFILIVYPFLAWTGLMMLGYCAGKLFHKDFDVTQRKKLLYQIGLGLIVFFIIIRFTNLYGNPTEWESQKTSWQTFLSFINVEKYPPSLLYLCLFIGVSLLLLALAENIKNKLTDILVVFGRTAFFYYVLHIYLIHFIAFISFFARGHSAEEATALAGQFPFMYLVPGEGFSLTMVYVLWISVVAALYPICHWYNKYKTAHPEKWWLSYL